MPQGHDITIHGENFDFYLYDPHATSHDDLLTPSSDSLFHVRSRISGQMLPFIGLSTFRQATDYLEDVKGAITRVITHGGRDQDVTALLPNEHIVSDNRMLSFQHLLDDAMFKASRGGWPPAPILREKPIEGYRSRYQLMTTLFTPISRLHHDQKAHHFPFADYQALMTQVEQIADAPETNADLVTSLRYFRNLWQDRVVNQDGSAEILKKPDTPVIAHLSNQMKTGFLKAVRDLTSEILDAHRDDDAVLRFCEAANRIAHISPSEHVLQRINRYLSVDIPDSDAPDRPHPAALAAAQLLVGDNPHLSVDDLLASQLFQPEHGRIYRVPNLGHDYRVSPHAEGMRQLSLARSDEGARNTFQFAERCDWSPLLFSQWGSDTSSLFTNAHYSRFWEDIEAGKPLRHILRGTLHADEQFAPEDASRRPLSKRSMHLYLHNAMAIDHINTAIKTQQACTPQTLYTDSGERFVISFDTTTAAFNPYARFPEQARVTYLNAEGEVVFDHQGEANRESDPRNLTRMGFKDLFKNPLHFLQLPAGKIHRFEEFTAVAGSLCNNKTLSNMMAKGYLAHLDQHTDDQGRKVARKEYQSWIDPVITNAEDVDAFSKYLSDTYLKDSDTIAEDISRALLLHMAKQSGLQVGSTLTTNDLASEEEIDKDEAFTLGGEEIAIEANSLSLTDRQKTAINYKKDMVDLADKLHHVGASLVKDHMPEVDLQWDAATDCIDLGTLEDGTRLHAKPLSSYGEIQRHGQTMSHCAGTYASQCMSGKYYLWAIIAATPDGQQREISTLGMRYDNDELEFDQHFGYDNARVEQPVSGMVDQLSKSLSQASADHDHDSDWGYDEYDDDLEDEADYQEDITSHTPRYDVSFEATSYQGGDSLTPEELSEVIVNYHWQSEEFGVDAMRLLSRIYGEEKVKENLLHTIDENLENRGEYHWSDDLVTRMKAFRQYVEDYDLHRQASLSPS